MTSSEAAVQTGGDDTTRLRRQVIAALVLLGVYGWLFHAFLYRQWRWAVEHQADWGHTLVIPLIAGYFVYLNRDKLRATHLKTTWAGLVPMLFGVVFYTVCTFGPDFLRHHNLHGFGAWLALVGIALLFFGFRGMRYLWFPLVFLLIFGQTISDRLMTMVTYRMQDIAAFGSFNVLLILGVDVERAGNTLTIFSGGEPKPLNIADACSGMRMLMAFLALGVFMAYTGLKYTWQRVLLVIMAVPTAIFINVLRVTTLGLLSILDVNFAAGDFHSFVGLVWLVPALLIYLGLNWIIRHLIVETPQAGTARK